MESLGTADIFLMRDHKVLLLLRDEIPTIGDQGCWSLPGGNLEPGESFDEGLRREVDEEIGLTLGPVRCLGEATGPDGRGHRKYYAEISEEDIASLRLGDEGQEFRLFSLREIDDLSLTRELSRIRYEHPDGFAQLFGDEPYPKPRELGLGPCDKE